MSKRNRPRRSVLVMPGSNPRALEKGKSLAADCLFLDLEDAVLPSSKENARGLIGEAVKAGGYGRRELLVRVNGLDTAWGNDDIAMIASFPIDGIILPKVEGPDAASKAIAILNASGAAKDMAIWCMPETPEGILNAREIAGASERVGGLIVGTADLAMELHCAHTRDRQPLIAALGMCVLAARAANIPVIDGVHLDLDDNAGFEHACRQGAELGFDGKTLIHPKQLDAANAAFAPSKDRIEWSKKIIEAHAEAAKEGKGIAVVHGKIVETLHVVEANRLIAQAEIIKELDSGSG